MHKKTAKKIILLQIRKNTFTQSYDTATDGEVQAKSILHLCSFLRIVQESFQIENNKKVL